jgi:ATP-dependent protease HslVU (ClpYQ) peptidase subunit
MGSSRAVHPIHALASALDPGKRRGMIMTVIAFDGRYIAADSQVTQGNRRSSTIWQKLVIEGGAVFGCTGVVQNFDDELIDAYFSDFSKCERSGSERGAWSLISKKGGKMQSLLGEGESTLVVFDGGKLLHFDGHSRGHTNSAPAAFGSGASYALGAMTHGAIAMAAVNIACQWDVTCSGDILYVDTKKIKAGVLVYGPTQRKIEQRQLEIERRKAAEEEGKLLLRMQKLAKDEVTLDGIAAEVDLCPGEICDFLPDITGKKKYADLAFAIEAWIGD